MPRIPTLDDQARLSPVQAPRISRQHSTGLQSLGAALGDVAQTLQGVDQYKKRVAEEEQLKADRVAFMEADRVLGERENTLLHDPAAGAFTKRGRDALDLTPTTLSEFDRAASEAEKGLTTDRQRMTFRQSLQQRRESVQRQLQTYEGRERENYYASERETYKKTAESAAVTNYRDPQRIEQEIDRARAAIDQTPGVSPEQKAAELAERRSGVYAGVIDRYLANDEVQGAEKYYGSVKDRVLGEQAANIERAIRVAKDRQEAKRDSGLALAKAELSDQVRDIESAFRQRIPISSVPSEARFVSLYGERGKKMHEQVKLMADASIDAAKLTQLSTEDVIKVAAGYTPTKVEGAAMRGEVAGIIQQQARMDLKERQDDPAGYLVRHSPSVQATWQDFANNGGDVSRYLTAVRGEQERLGLPGGDLLPNEYADHVATQISQAGAEGMTSLIQSESARWGDAWPQVYGQLAPKMTDIAAVIGSGIPTYAADALASTAGLKTQELAAMIPPGTTMKDVRDAVAEEFAAFNQSFPVDAARTVGAFNDAAVRLSARYMQQGMGSSDAASKALRDIAGNYEINEFRSVPYRVPKAYDAGAVEDSADRIIREYSASSGAIDANGSVLADVELQSQYAEYVRDNGYWMTAPDESGLRLYVDGGPVVTGNGPLQYTWDQLTQRAVKDRSEAMKLQRGEESRALIEGLR